MYLGLFAFWPGPNALRGSISECSDALSSFYLVIASLRLPGRWDAGDEGAAIGHRRNEVSPGWCRPLTCHCVDARACRGIHAIFVNPMPLQFSFAGLTREAENAVVEIA